MDVESLANTEILKEHVEHVLTINPTKYRLYLLDGLAEILTRKVYLALIHVHLQSLQTPLKVVEVPLSGEENLIWVEKARVLLL